MSVITIIPFVVLLIILIFLIIGVFYIFITQPDAQDDLSNSDDNSDDCYNPYPYDDFI